MNVNHWHLALNAALAHPWTSLFAKIVALILLYGATVHLGNIAGLTGTPWLQTPFLWRGLDIALLLFNGVTAIALWQGLSWSIPLLFGGIFVLQILPYTVWRSHFITKPEDAMMLTQLITTELTLLGIFCGLLLLKK